MSAFVPPNSDGNQGQHGSIQDMYSQFPYFPVIGSYSGTAANGYQFNPAAFGFPNGFQNAFPNMSHNQNTMNNMMNFSAHSQIPQLPTDQNALAARFLQNNNLPLYNQKTEFLEQTSSLTTLTNAPANDSKSTLSSTNDSIGSGDSSNSENHTPARKRAAKTPKREFKSPEEETSYRVRRQKNNEAARMSRIRRQQREAELQKENDQLRKENSQLKNEIDLWKHKYGKNGLTQRLNPVLNEIQNH